MELRGSIGNWGQIKGGGAGGSMEAGASSFWLKGTGGVDSSGRSTGSGLAISGTGKGSTGDSVCSLPFGELETGGRSKLRDSGFSCKEAESEDGLGAGEIEGLSGEDSPSNFLS